MNILIQGMEMPKRYEILCLFSDGSIGMLDTYSVFNPARPIDCAKAVSLPEGHGRLIDADALKHELMVSGIIDYYGTQINLKIDNSPTIVPAEGG